MAWLSVLWGVLLCVVDSLQHAQPPSVTILCPLIRRSSNPVLNAVTELNKGAAVVIATHPNTHAQCVAWYVDDWARRSNSEYDCDSFLHHWSLAGCWLFNVSCNSIHRSALILSDGAMSESLTTQSLMIPASCSLFNWSMVKRVVMRMG
jgi:hypothetical protein